ncbi:ATP-binding protein [Cryptosporangium phraense]|uniref:histidine kinase n=1 Tax=Cryptosporangium phraense TaxID=2593070 RepID=A0A545AKB7_9ACTN|nr:ATP-binding protein [Cryptosporangium phraense]TQS41195.1 GAF domain-containing protein [Cryptosporangium phraense]
MSFDHALLARQTEILEQIAAGVPLSGVLTGIASTFEELVPGCSCSVLLLDGGTLRHGAAPSLPRAYSSAIDGLPIGESAGSCGAAAFTGRPVVAVDVRLDPRWERYRTLADRFGLRSCWSTPISGRDGVTGTFAVYHRRPHEPTDRETRLVERLTHLASVAIDHDGLLGALTESEERFRRAFEDNAVGMALATLDGRITRVNRAMRALLGVDLIGACLDDVFTRTASGSRPDAYEATAEAADGRRLDLAVAVSPIQDHALSVNVLDITGRRAAERERRRRVEAELAQHAAEAANRAKTDFVSALGHELRTPLQAITGFTELLGTLDLDRDRRSAALGHITAAAGHILAMVDDVLDVARIEANVLPLTVTAVPLGPVVTEVLAMLDPLATAERVGLSLTAGPPVELAADQRRLRQVLLNLVGNAIRYNRADGTVAIAWTASGEQAEITIRDTGPGIGAEYLDRLFVPFDRLGADSEEGVGLGLPLARGLTEAMGGTLGVHSELGRGTTVTVTLPAGPGR